MENNKIINNNIIISSVHIYICKPTFAPSCIVILEYYPTRNLDLHISVCLILYQYFLISNKYLSFKNMHYLNQTWMLNFYQISL